MSTEFMMVILLWCSPPFINVKFDSLSCRENKIQCVKSHWNSGYDKVFSICFNVKEK